MFLIYHSYYGGNWEVCGYLETEEQAKEFIEKNESKYIKYRFQKINKLSMIGG